MTQLEIDKVISILQVVLKESPIRKGNQLKFHCFKCNHRKHKLEISVLDNACHCWICNYSGSIKKLLYDCGCPISNIQEINAIYGNYKYKKVDEEEGDSQLFLPNEFKPLHIPNKDIEYKHAIYYCKKRGLTASDIIKYNIHYCVDGNFRNRIILPSYDSNGCLNYYTGRTWCEDVGLKYLNPDISRNVIGFDLFINWGLGWITLCEGPMDAVAIKMNAIPLFGKTLSEKLRHKIIENKTKRINVLLDSDAKKDIIIMAESLLNEGIEVGVHILKEKDPSVLGFNKMYDIIKNIKPIGFSELMQLRLF